MPRRFGGPTKARLARPRLRGAACRRPQRLPGRDRLRSVGSVRSQADEARRHAGGRTSGNGPDTSERAPLDARGWVPSVFRARPANDKENRLTRPCAFTMEPPGCARSRWSPRRNAAPSPRGRGAKGKSRAKARRRRDAA
ncbi:unnamed protein product, partial [Pelagomonas calceolata]